MMSTKGGGNEQALAHLSYHCPGLHGKGTKQDIKRKTFRQFFKENGRLIIPLVQRRYCWTDKTLWHWFEDVVRGKRDHLGIHNSGNVVVKKSSHNEGLIIIDGQQRITTTLLLLSALSDELRKIRAENLEQLSHRSRQTLEKFQKDLESIIFLNGFESNDSDIKLLEGEDFKDSRLLPSFCDRKSFFELIQGPISEQNKTEEISYQCRAKEIFKSRISQEMTQKQVFTYDDKVEWFSEVVHQALDLMGLTYVEIINDINMAQVFLYLQEMSLFGEGAMLHNPTPGIHFTSIDMTRNLLLSPTMDQSINDQEIFYRKYWLEPIEVGFARKDQIENFIESLDEFVKLKTQTLTHVSGAETKYLKVMNASTNITPRGKQYLTTYAKLTSLYEKISMDNSEKEGSISEAGGEPKEPSTEHLLQASILIASELSKFVARKKLEKIKNSESWE